MIQYGIHAQFIVQFSSCNMLFHIIVRPAFSEIYLLDQAHLSDLHHYHHPYKFSTKIQGLKENRFHLDNDLHFGYFFILNFQFNCFLDSNWIEFYGSQGLNFQNFQHHFLIHFILI